MNTLTWARDQYGEALEAGFNTRKQTSTNNSNSHSNPFFDLETAIGVAKPQTDTLLKEKILTNLDLKESNRLNIGGINTLTFKEPPLEYKKTAILEELRIETRVSDQEKKTNQAFQKTTEVTKPNDRKVEVSFLKEINESMNWVGKQSFFLGKETSRSIIDLFKDYILFKVKNEKSDPKAEAVKLKENQQALIKKKFFDKLRQAINEFALKKQKQESQEEENLGISGMSIFERNDLLGKNRNKSFSDIKTSYHRHSVAVALAQKRLESLKQQKSKELPKITTKTNYYTSLKHADEIKGGGAHMLTAVG